MSCHTPYHAINFYTLQPQHLLVVRSGFRNRGCTWSPGPLDSLVADLTFNVCRNVFGSEKACICVSAACIDSRAAQFGYLVNQSRKRGKMAKYIVYVENIIANRMVTTTITSSYVHPHFATLTRISSYAKRSGYRRRKVGQGNAYAVAIILEQIVAARCTLLHKGLEEVLYRNESTLPPGFQWPSPSAAYADRTGF